MKMLFLFALFVSPSLLFSQDYEPSYEGFETTISIKTEMTGEKIRSLEKAADSQYGSFVTCELSVSENDVFTYRWVLGMLEVTMPTGQSLMMLRTSPGEGLFGTWEWKTGNHYFYDEVISITFAPDRLDIVKWCEGRR